MVDARDFGWAAKEARGKERGRKPVSPSRLQRSKPNWKRQRRRCGVTQMATACNRVRAAVERRVHPVRSKMLAALSVYQGA